jgi:4-hydroxy-tetrahydrodipicolinate synthase
MLQGKVDYSSLGRLIDFQIREGIHGLVAVGTTGESPTLDYDEHIEVIRFTVARVAGRVPVLAGTGSNNTAEQLELTQRALDVGATAFLLVAPYYNKPTQEGLYRHYAAVARMTDKPIILYSVPSRCGVEIAVSTVKRLRQDFPNIIGLKESGGTLDRVAKLLQAVDPDFVLLSGNDDDTFPYLGLGAHGVISVASNLVVRPLVELVRLARAGDLPAAEKIHRDLTPLFKNLFIEPNPTPIKHALFRAGLITSPEVRLPLVEMTDPGQATLDATLHDLKLA